MWDSILLSSLFFYAVTTDVPQHISNRYISNHEHIHKNLDILVFETGSVDLIGKGQIICDETKIAILGLNYEKLKSESQTTKCKSVMNLRNYVAELERIITNNSE